MRQERGEDFIFKDDNARPHRTKYVQNVLENANMQRLTWPTNSPDMNPMEHVWNVLRQAILRRLNPPTSPKELIVALQDEWANIS